MIKIKGWRKKGNENEKTTFIPAIKSSMFSRSSGATCLYDD